MRMGRWGHGSAAPSSPTTSPRCRASASSMDILCPWSSRGREVAGALGTQGGESGNGGGWCGRQQARSLALKKTGRGHHQCRCLINGRVPLMAAHKTSHPRARPGAASKVDAG
jgi:hypothetical protein